MRDAAQGKLVLGGYAPTFPIEIEFPVSGQAVVVVSELVSADPGRSATEPSESSI